MLFNSIQYVIFLILSVIIYYLLPQKYRNIFLLVISYYFYMCWIPEYAILILFSTFVTYITSRLVAKYENDIKKKKIFMFIGIFINLLILFVFKYFNFFINSINKIFSIININIALTNKFTLLLPVGISFYTFQAIGYCVDVYRKDVKVEKNFIKYALFVSLFPQLVAGPIERSKNLLNQFDIKHDFSYEQAVCGMRYILDGMFRKIVVADTCAIFANAIFNNVHSYSGLTLVFGIFMFAIQIYCDFSGYSRIAIGSGKLLGFELMENFKSPYFSKSISEFWSRWHISLSTWFKDYIYIPLGGNRKGFKRKCINLFLIFVISGLWHGAALTFVAWGIMHGFYRVCEELIKKLNFKIKYNINYLKMFFTFLLICFAWIFFRANSIREAFYIIYRIFNDFSIGHLIDNIYTIITSELFFSKLLRYFIIATMFLSIMYLTITDYIIYKKSINISEYFSYFGKIRYILYYIIALIIIFVFILLNGVYGQTGQFIYFQF